MKKKIGENTKMKIKMSEEDKDGRKYKEDMIVVV